MKRSFPRPIPGMAALFAVVLMTTATAQENNQPPEGFASLFNGENLDGWTGGTTRDPRQIAAMPADEREAHGAKLQEAIGEHWRVEGGALISDGQGPHLVTTRGYGNFELWVDYMLKANGDSGVYLRDTPQVQIWDPSNVQAHRHGSDKGSGGLWNNKTHARFPTEVADRPIGEWNRMYIQMVGQYVTVKLNGMTVVENVVMENFFERSLPVFKAGTIHLQTHGSETRFRNVFIREIPDPEADQLLADARGGEDGFESLFNGEDLTGWIGATENYEVVNGAVRCKAGHGGNLLTKDMYGDFIVRLEFKLPPGGNNGLAIRTPGPDVDAAYAGIELQVLDDTAEKFAELAEYQYHGSAYGLAPAARGYLRPVGQWNFQEVRVQGDQVQVVLNGFTILDTNLTEALNKRIDGRDHPGASRTEGHFGFCGHNDPVEFRNIRIKSLGPGE